MSFLKNEKIGIKIQNFRIKSEILRSEFRNKIQIKMASNQLEGNELFDAITKSKKDILWAIESSKLNMSIGSINSIIVDTVTWWNGDTYDISVTVSNGALSFDANVGSWNIRLINNQLENPNESNLFQLAHILIRMTNAKITRDIVTKQVPNEPQVVVIIQENEDAYEGSLYLFHNSEVGTEWITLPLLQYFGGDKLNSDKSYILNWTDYFKFNARTRSNIENHDIQISDVAPKQEQSAQLSRHSTPEQSLSPYNLLPFYPLSQSYHKL